MPWTNINNYLYSQTFDISRFVTIIIVKYRSNNMKFYGTKLQTSVIFGRSNITQLKRIAVVCLFVYIFYLHHDTLI